MEVKAKITGGQGIWPAIWMLPTDNSYGSWPRSGEIDILEAVNLGVGSNKDVHGTLHYGLDWPQWRNHGKTLSLDANPADDFHVYANGKPTRSAGTLMVFTIRHNVQKDGITISGWDDRKDFLPLIHEHRLISGST